VQEMIIDKKKRNSKSKSPFKIKYTLETPSYCSDSVINITHTLSEKYRAINVNLSRDDFSFIAR